MIDSTQPQGRKAEFALGSMYKADEQGTLRNAVTQTGNDVTADVQHAVSNQPRTSEAYARDLGFHSQADMRGEDW